VSASTLRRVTQRLLRFPAASVPTIQDFALPYGLAAGCTGAARSTVDFDTDT